MSRGARKHNLDGNHHAISDALRAIGAKPVSTASVGSGFPDIAVGYRGVNVLLEVKNGDKPPSKQALTEAEKNFHETWPGQISIVRTPEEAVIAVINYAAARGIV